MTSLAPLLREPILSSLVRFLIITALVAAFVSITTSRRWHERFHKGRISLQPSCRRCRYPADTSPHTRKEHHR